MQNTNIRIHYMALQILVGRRTVRKIWTGISRKKFSDIFRQVSRILTEYSMKKKKQQEKNIKYKSYMEKT